MESAQQQAQGAQDTPTLQKSSHVLPTTGEEEREADAQSELREHLEMIKLEVHPFLQPPFEDATFFPEALLRYIRRNKPYALSDDQEYVNALHPDFVITKFIQKRASQTWQLSEQDCTDLEQGIWSSNLCSCIMGRWEARNQYI
jgi:hypothetical protein